jgi:hypothetical protein
MLPLELLGWNLRSVVTLSRAYDPGSVKKSCSPMELLLCRGTVFLLAIRNNRGLW